MRNRNAASRNFDVITPGTDLKTPAEGRLHILATAAGNVGVKLSGGQTLVVAVPVGSTWLDGLSVIGIVSGGVTTATATYNALV